MQRKLVSILLLMLLAMTLACAASSTLEVTATLTPTPTVVEVGQGTEAPPDPGTAPTATATPTPGCTFAAAYVADVTVPDNTAFLPNTPFVKTWRMRNSGTCDWEPGSLFVYVSGDPLGGPASVPLPAAAVDTSVDVNIDFISPNTPDTYRSNWQAQSPAGVRFGGQFYVQIVVPDPTPTPTHTPEPTILVPLPTLIAPIADWPVYRNGNTGPNVYAIQYLLRAEGATITADGIFGPGTLNAVKAFQQARGLTADGVVGRQTWAELIKNHTLQTGNNGDAIRAAQYLLANVYGYTIAVDGAFGPGTRNAVRSFQTAQGLTSDGIVGQDTWKALVVGP